MKRSLLLCTVILALLASIAYKPARADDPQATIAQLTAELQVTRQQREAAACNSPLDKLSKW